MASERNGFSHYARLSITLLITACLLGCDRSTTLKLPLPPNSVFTLSQLPEVLRGHRVVILGESHGLIEPVDTVKAMLTASPPARRFTHLAMEWSVSDQPAIDRYLAGDDAALEQTKRAYAGQLSFNVEYYLSLVGFVRELNQRHPEAPIKVCLIDVPSPIQSTPKERRDEHMAQRIESVLDSDPACHMLVIVGSSHAAKCGMTFYGDDKGGGEWMEPLGARLQTRYPGQFAVVKMLSSSDPMWGRLKSARQFDGPVAIRLSSEFPKPDQIFSMVQWRNDFETQYPDHPQRVYDYVVWWPTSRQAASKVIKTIPAAGEQNVDPTLKELVVSFDRDMSLSCAWTVEGNNFPNIAKSAKPIWRDARTCTLAVELEPNRAYTFGINGSGLTNFRGLDGMPADPMIISFTTRSAAKENVN